MALQNISSIDLFILRSDRIIDIEIKTVGRFVDYLLAEIFPSNCISLEKEILDNAHRQQG